jgi:hypothetical protein
MLMRLWFVALVFFWHTSASAVDAERAASQFKEGYSEPKLVPVLGGWAGDDSAVTEKTLQRITDETSWAMLWQRHHPAENAPAVDFSKAMVIAIFTGSVSSSYYGFGLNSAIESGGIIQLTSGAFWSDVIDDKTKNLYLFVVLPRSKDMIAVCEHISGIMMAPQNAYDTFGEIDPLP